MKYTPNFDDDHFYRIDRDVADEPKNWLDEDDTKEKSTAEKIFSRLWTPPVKRKGDDDSVVWTSLYLKRLAASWLEGNLFGFFLKLISMTILPALWSLLGWGFVTLFLKEEIPTSCYIATALFLWMLRDSVLVLPARPGIRDFIQLFCHEVALKWLMWTVGSIAYLLAVNYFNVKGKEAKWDGVIAGVITYLLTIENVWWRNGAAGILGYLWQVLQIVCVTAFFTVLGGAIPFVLGAMAWKCWGIAWLFGFVSFWIAVNLFYWPTGHTIKQRAWGESITQE